MLDISVVPNPQLDNASAYGGAALALVVGTVLLLWGRKISRLFMMLLGVTGGVLLADPLMERLPSMAQNPGLFKLVCVVILAALGVVAAPAIWSLLAGVIGVVAACSALVVGYLLHSDTPVTVEACESFEHWGRLMWEVARESWDKMCQQQGTEILLVILPSGLVPLMIGMWRRQLITILMTSLVGAVAIVGGVWLGLVQCAPKLWPRMWNQFWLPIALVGLLFAVGVIFQYVRARAARKKKRAREEDEEIADPLGDDVA